MEINPEILRKELIEIYKKYIEDQNNPETLDKAFILYKKYMSVDAFIDPSISTAIAVLVDFNNFPHVKTKKEDAQRILKELEALDVKSKQ